jgi:hypothetical protein
MYNSQKFNFRNIPMSQPAQERDEHFYQRADAHINLANEHINTQQTKPVDANDALLYASARFNAWIVAASFPNADDMKKDKTNAIEYFTNAYKTVLEEHFDDYVENYEVYMKSEG